VFTEVINDLEEHLLQTSIILLKLFQNVSYLPMGCKDLRKVMEVRGLKSSSHSVTPYPAFLQCGRKSSDSGFSYYIDFIQLMNHPFPPGRIKKGVIQDFLNKPSPGIS
jgi:hypothetical protein